MKGVDIYEMDGFRYAVPVEVYPSEFGGPYPPTPLHRRLYCWFLHTFYPDEMKNETRWFYRALDRLYYGGTRYDDEGRVARLATFQVERVRQ